MQRSYQRLQFGTRTPVRVLVAVLLRVIPCPFAVCTRRQPYIVEISTYLGCLRRQGLPLRIAVCIHARRFRVIRLVVERLHHHCLALTRNGSSVDFLYILAVTAVRSVTDIQLVLLVLQLDIEVIATVHIHVITVIRCIVRKTGYRIGIQWHRPSGLVLHIIQLQLVTAGHLHMRQVLLKSFILPYGFSGIIGSAVHEDTIVGCRHTQCRQSSSEKCKNLFH